MDIVKTWIAHFLAISFTFSDAMDLMKFLSLAVATGYTIYQWVRKIRENKNNRHSKGDS